MRSKLRILLWIGAGVLLCVVASELYLQIRPGRYPIYPASSYSKLAAAPTNMPVPADLVVQTDAGALRGAAAGSIVAFRGIPYARPPVGDLRWEAPQPALPWQGVREAVHPGRACTQRVSGLLPFFAPMAQAYGTSFTQPPVDSSEDCLFLDVWVPQWPVKNPLPVMVWLHGGSNTVGSGTESTYNGASLAAHGVVLVTLNYRLGVMGFFSHPELSAKSAHRSSGNYGLLDQLAALNWVRQNIAQFGGDPNNVTLFGESAGAIDAARLMTSPLAAGLFRRVISESGPAFETSRTLAEAESFGSAVGALAPADSQLSELQRLRALPAADVEKLVAKAKEHLPVDITSATTDGWVLPQSPQNAFLTSSIQKVDLLIGLNGRELSAFRLAAAAAAKSTGNESGVAQSASLKQFSEIAQPYFGLWTKPVVGLYLGKMLVHGSAGLDQAANDILVACPVGAMASLTRAAGQHVFVYRFNRIIPGKGGNELGAFHSLEVPYVFGSLHDPEWQWLPSTTDDAALSALLQTYWTDFAKSGDPNATGLPNWPLWSDDKMEFLEIRQDASISAQRNFSPPLSHLSADELKESFTDRRRTESR
jgi:para-nitrobenzyl esterase